GLASGLRGGLCARIVSGVSQDPATDFRAIGRAGHPLARGTTSVAPGGGPRGWVPLGFLPRAREETRRLRVALGGLPEEAVHGRARISLHLERRAEGGIGLRPRRQQDCGVLCAADLDPIRDPACATKAAGAVKQPDRVAL